ncbi:MAG: sigma-70 family RNA polymerase sigma factor [Chitinophagales bacterium]|nr:sigma-70 family RNA polymerase sigma factor [Chitinophagales bacterium]
MRKLCLTVVHQSTERIVRRNELNGIIEEVLMQIPDDYRMVFSLREINQMNVAETAELLNISEANVKVRLSRAKEMLRNKLEISYSTTELFDYHALYCDPMTEKVMKLINRL